MALARARQQARRVKDRWKAKTWYTVTAPPAFNNHIIGETLADDNSKVMGRTVETTLQDLTGDMRQMHIKLAFKVINVTDTNATTEFVGHAMTSDYVRRLTRRGHTRIPAVFDVKTRDGSRVRVKPFAVSDRRCQTTQAQEIRRIITDMITKTAAEETLAGFLKAVLVGELSNSIYKEARKIHPLRRIEIAKTEILKAPTIEMDETPLIIEPPRDDEEEGEAVAAGDDSEEE